MGWKVTSICHFSSERYPYGITNAPILSRSNERGKYYKSRREPAYFTAVSFQTADGAGRGNRKAPSDSRQAQNRIDRGRRSAPEAGRGNPVAGGKDGAGLKFRPSADQRRSCNWRKSDDDRTPCRGPSALTISGRAFSVLQQRCD